LLEACPVRTGLAFVVFMTVILRRPLAHKVDAGDVSPDRDTEGDRRPGALSRTRVRRSRCGERSDQAGA